MDLSSLFTVKNIILICSIVIIIQIIKEIVKNSFKVEPPVWIWKVTVIALGPPAALMAGEYGGWREFVIMSIIYAAVASLLYQSGKLTVSAAAIWITKLLGIGEGK